MMRNNDYYYLRMMCDELVWIDVDGICDGREKMRGGDGARRDKNDKMIKGWGRG